MSAVGTLITSVWIAGRLSHGSIERIQTVFAISFSVGLVALALAPNYVVALMFIFVLGASSSAFQVSNNALVATTVDPVYQGRVQALLMMGFSVSSMASLPFGAIADRFGLRPTMAAMGLACVATVAIAPLLKRKALARDPRTSTDMAPVPVRPELRATS